MFPLIELKEMARGRGLMLIDLAKKDVLAGVALISQNPLRLQGVGRAGKPVESILEPRAQATFHGSRARRGQEIPFKFKPTGLFVDL